MGTHKQTIRFSIFALLGLLLMSLFIPFVKAHALSGSDFNTLDTSKIQVTIVDRFHIRLAFPDTPLFKSGADTLTFDKAYSGIYTDGKLSDATWNYDFTSSNRDAATGHITGFHFDPYVPTSSPFTTSNSALLTNGAAFSDAQIKEVLKDLEINLVYDDGGGYFIYGNDNQWHHHEDSNPWAQWKTPKLPFGQLGNIQNFNITYESTPDQITNLYKVEDYYVACPNNTYAQQDCEVGAGDDKKYIDATADQLKGNGTVELTLHDGQTTFQIHVAQNDNAASANAAQAPGSVTDGSATCEGSDFSGLGWISCSILRLVDEGIKTLDEQISKLLTIPPNYYQDSYLEKSWASIRNISNLGIVIVLLIIIISQAISIGPFDAYTIKKILPRLVFAVIAIQLSWFLTTKAIVITNDIGGGVAGLLAAPFGGLDALSLGKIITDVSGPLGVSFVAIAAVPGTIAFVLFFGVTALLIALMAFFLLTLRQFIIVVCIVFAPIALLLSILPGTRKIWDIWEDTFTKLLIFYPLMMGMIAAGRIFAKIVASTNPQGYLTNAAQFVIVIMAFFLPYALIPIIFRFAGGVLANISGVANDRSKGLFDRARESRHRSIDRRISKPILQQRAEAVRRLQGRGSGAGKFGAFAYRQAARSVGGYNIEAASSAFNAQRAKEIGDQIATGRDDDIRGLTVDMKRIKSMGYAEAARQGLYQEKDGKRQYKSLGGQWVDEANVLAGQKRWGNDHSAQQAALSYEMRKAITDEQIEDVSTRYAGLAKSQWGMTDQEAAGAWIGAGFENQNQHLEFKNTDWNTGQLNAAKFATEVYEKKGTYPLSQMSAHTITQLKNAYDTAGSAQYRPGATAEQIAAAQDTQRKIRGVAEAFMYRGGSRGQTGALDDVPIKDTRPVEGGGDFLQTNAQGAAHVNEAVRDFAVHVGVYQPLDPSTGFRSDAEHPTGPGGRNMPPEPKYPDPRQN